MPSTTSRPHPLLLLPFLSMLTITFSSTDDPSIDCSSSSTCGGVGISYPFRRSDVGPPSSSAVHCGYPGFMIVCEEDKHPILQIGSGRYNVSHIDYSRRTINLTDTDMLTGPDDHSSCARVVHHNLTFTSDLASSLSYTGADANLTFFFNCSYESPWGNFLPNVISCLGYNSERISYVSRSDDVPPADIWNGTCEDVVVAPVLLDSLINPLLDPTQRFSDAPYFGFQLTWIAGAPQGCEECERHGGRCGFNRTSGSALCFCPDGTPAGDCGASLFNFMPVCSFSLPLSAVSIVNLSGLGSHASNT